MKSHQNFLNFNGEKLLFLSVDGVYWIALKPILSALKMDADRSLKTLKKDPILGSARSIQAVQVSKKGIFQGRNMVCLPEKYIYGWIFSLRSDSAELIEYKKTCYELLYDHFHGTITNRKELLINRREIDTEIFDLKQSMKEDNEKYKRLQELQNQRKTLSTRLNSSDHDLIKAPELFT